MFDVLHFGFGAADHKFQFGIALVEIDGADNSRKALVGLRAEPNVQSFAIGRGGVVEIAVVDLIDNFGEAWVT